MTLTRVIFTATLALGLSSNVMADPLLEDVDEVEEIPNKKLERRGERIKGPITSVRAGALVFASFDTDMDYAVSQAEFTSGLTKAFKAADKDSTKTLSLFELEDWREAALGSLDAAPGTLAFDKDYDQRITRAEFDHALGFVFNASDKNEDGTLDFTELVTVFEMPRRPVIEEDEDPIERINRQSRRDQQRRRGY